MTEKTTQQLIKEYEANMPSEILNIIKAFDWRKELRGIVNQNQIMIDVGADLEESVYLMILGIVTVDDVYERMIDVHEYSEDKTKKILEEIESRIFNPMTKRLSSLDEEDEKESIITQAQNHSGSGQVDALRSTPVHEDVVTPTTSEDQTRDAILREIEEEPAEIEIGLKNVPQAMSPATPAPIEFSANGEIKSETSNISPSNMRKEPMFKSIPQDAGVRKPFSIRDQMPQSEVVSGIQEDPMTTGFTKSTQMEAPKAQTEPASPSQSKAIDPYREPIE